MPSPVMNIFEEVKARGIKFDHHESDLYIPVTEETHALVDRLQSQKVIHVTTFTCQIDGKQWYDIPFSYTPWWEARVSRPMLEETPGQQAERLYHDENYHVNEDGQRRPE